MTIQQASEILDKATATLKLSRSEHQLVVQALNVLISAIALDQPKDDRIKAVE